MGLGVSFDDTYHTYDDWGMMWESIEVSAPEPITHYIKVPGRKTLIDATETLYGGIVYNPREFKCVFHRFGLPRDIELLKSDIYRAIEGKCMKIRTDLDPDKYMVGRPVVKFKMVAANVAEIEITAQVDPYKYYDEVPNANWLWDSFSFVNGHILENDIIFSVNGTSTVSVNGPSYEAGVTIVASAPGKITVAENTDTLSSGTNVLNCKIPAGSNSYTITGAGTYRFIFKGEEL